ncbi:50S ribosomal protein L10 [Candidatus Uhrbacteria bacterium]|nr:50S ribosomal protein L10 [Candidatus Uhrbacteria bacterium]
MPKTKVQKVKDVEAIAERIGRMAGAVFADFQGVKIGALEDLRRKSRSEGCEYLVVKKTLFQRAATDAKAPFDAAAITGSLSVLFGFTDPVAPARVAKEFTKTNPTMRVLGGFIREASGLAALDASSAIALGGLPSRDELRAKVVGCLANPLRGMVGVLHGNLRKFVYVLNAIQQAKS